MSEAQVWLKLNFYHQGYPKLENAEPTPALTGAKLKLSTVANF